MKTNHIICRISVIVIGLLLYSGTVLAQTKGVGIDTNTPATMLDVNGDIRVREEIRLGGAEGVKGSAGTAGQGFTSKGPGKSPVWSPLMTDASAGFGIFQSVVKVDSIGVVYSSITPIASLSEEFVENSPLSAANGWTEIVGLRSYIKPTDDENRVVVTLQTVAQSPLSSDLADAEVGIGIFIDGKLKMIRSIHVSGSNQTFTVGTLFDSFVNLPVKANDESYLIQVASTVRYNHPLDAYVGGYITSTYAGDWAILVGTTHTSTNNTSYRMNRTSLKIDLYQEIK